MPRFSNPVGVYGGIMCGWLFVTTPHWLSCYVYGSQNKHRLVWEAEAERRAALEASE